MVARQRRAASVDGSGRCGRAAGGVDCAAGVVSGGVRGRGGRGGALQAKAVGTVPPTCSAAIPWEGLKGQRLRTVTCPLLKRFTWTADP